MPRYNPDINCNAYAPDALRTRLTDLEREQRNPAIRNSAARRSEMARITNHLTARLSGGSTRPETYAELKARSYPSQMATPTDPAAPFVRAIVGPNRSSSAASSYEWQ